MEPDEVSHATALDSSVATRTTGARVGSWSTRSAWVGDSTSGVLGQPLIDHLPGQALSMFLREMRVPRYRSQRRVAERGPQFRERGTAHCEVACEGVSQIVKAKVVYAGRRYSFGPVESREPRHPVEIREHEP